MDTHIQEKTTENKLFDGKLVYFSIIPTAAGFTDQLMQFSTFYKLGLVLGYKYFHKDFSSARSNFLRTSLLDRVSGRIIDYTPRSIKTFLAHFGVESAFDVYDFLGINPYFNSMNLTPKANNLKIIDIDLNDDFLIRANMSCVEDVKNSILEYVECQAPIDKTSTPLVRFKVSGKRKKLFSWINSNIPNSRDLLDLRSIYLNRRAILPWKSQFPEERTKILVHIRQGDIGVIETPWGTYIPADVRRPDWLNEYKNFDDINPSENIFRVADYFKFLKELSLYFDKDSYSLLSFSDGYERTFEILESNLDKLRIDSEAKIRELKNHRKSHNKRCFEILSKLEHSEYFVGESSKNLRHLIHSALNADVIITSSQQRMLLKLVSLYCDDIKPLVIVLYRGKRPSNQDISPKDEERFIYTDLNNLNFHDIASKIASL
jgi:hypothetical protein